MPADSWGREDAGIFLPRRSAAPGLSSSDLFLMNCSVTDVGAPGDATLRPMLAGGFRVSTDLHIPSCADAVGLRKESVPFAYRYFRESPVRSTPGGSPYRANPWMARSMTEQFTGLPASTVRYGTQALLLNRDRRKVGAWVGLAKRQPGEPRVAKRNIERGYFATWSV